MFGEQDCGLLRIYGGQAAAWVGARSMACWVGAEEGMVVEVLAWQDRQGQVGVENGFLSMYVRIYLLSQKWNNSNLVQ